MYDAATTWSVHPRLLEIIGSERHGPPNFQTQSTVDRDPNTVQLKVHPLLTCKQLPLSRWQELQPTGGVPESRRPHGCSKTEQHRIDHCLSQFNVQCFRRKMTGSLAILNSLSPAIHISFRFHRHLSEEGLAGAEIFGYGASVQKAMREQFGETCCYRGTPGSLLNYIFDLAFKFRSSLNSVHTEELLVVNRANPIRQITPQQDRCVSTAVASRQSCHDSTCTLSQ